MGRRLLMSPKGASWAHRHGWMEGCSCRERGRSTWGPWSPRLNATAAPTPPGASRPGFAGTLPPARHQVGDPANISSPTGTWNAVYVRDPSLLDEQALQSLRPEFSGTLEARRWRGWTELALGGLQDGAGLARRVSRERGVEAFWVQLQTTASVRCIVHHDAGELSRRLVHSDGGWRTAEGRPLPWEDSTLFSPQKLGTCSAHPPPPCESEEKGTGAACGSPAGCCWAVPCAWPCSSRAVRRCSFSPPSRSWPPERGCASDEGSDPDADAPDGRGRGVLARECPDR